MPLRDHFHGSFRGFTRWEGFHSTWVHTIMRALNRTLPGRYQAVPSVHLGVYVAPDVTTVEREPDLFDPPAASGNGVATAVWAPPAPTATLDAATPAQDEFAVHVYDAESGERVVAALELVSPSNKDRADHREAFVAKCVTLLERQVCVAIVDVVTDRSANLHAEVVRRLGGREVPPAAAGDLYAAVYRGVKAGDRWGLDVWAYPLAVGAALPTLPLWVAPDLSVPLDLEATYAETGRDMRLW